MVWVKKYFPLKSSINYSVKFFAHKSDVSLANSLEFEPKLSDKSFIHVKKSNGPRIKP